MPSKGFDDSAREEIAASWRRSVLSGLRHDRLDLLYDPETNRDAYAPCQLEDAS